MICDFTTSLSAGQTEESCRRSSLALCNFKCAILEVSTGGTHHILTLTSELSSILDILATQFPIVIDHLYTPTEHTEVIVFFSSSIVGAEVAPTASKIMVSQPQLDLRLQTDRICCLNHQPRFSLVAFLTLTGEQPVTLIRDGSGRHIGLKQTLVSQCIECFDDDSGQRIPVLDSKHGSQSTNSEADWPELIILEPQKSSYITFTTATSPHDYEFVFDSSHLKQDRTYNIHCKPSALGWWSLDSKEKIEEYFKTHGELPTSESPPLRCDSANVIVKFDTRGKVQEAPKVSVSLSAPSIMSLSGKRRFEFSLTFISHATSPITVLAERDSAKAGNADMEILDSATKKRVAPDMIDAGNMDGPWLREEFLRLNPGEPYVEHRVFDPTDIYSGLEDLKPHTDYVLRMVDTEWGWWSFDDIDTVMEYAGERGSGRLGPAKAIHLICYEEAKFHVVP